jgi:hypothetical protein
MANNSKFLPGSSLQVKVTKHKKFPLMHVILYSKNIVRCNFNEKNYKKSVKSFFVLRKSDFVQFRNLLQCHFKL